MLHNSNWQFGGININLVWETTIRYTLKRNILRLIWFSAHLFQCFEPKKHVLKKASLLCAFGLAQNATFWKKICILYLWRNAHITERSSELHFGKTPMHVWIFPLDSQGNYQITLSHHCSFLSSLCFALCSLNNKFPNPNSKKSITNSQIS